MPCIHACFGCDRTEPKPSEKKILPDGKVLYSLLPSCHPGADEGKFETCAPPTPPAVVTNQWLATSPKQ